MLFLDVVPTQGAGEAGTTWAWRRWTLFSQLQEDNREWTLFIKFHGFLVCMVALDSLLLMVFFEARRNISLQWANICYWLRIFYISYIFMWCFSALSKYLSEDSSKYLKHSWKLAGVSLGVRYLSTRGRIKAHKAGPKAHKTGAGHVTEQKEGQC